MHAASMLQPIIDGVVKRYNKDVVKAAF